MPSKRTSGSAAFGVGGGAGVAAGAGVGAAGWVTSARGAAEQAVAHANAAVKSQSGPERMRRRIAHAFGRCAYGQVISACLRAGHQRLPTGRSSAPAYGQAINAAGLIRAVGTEQP